MGRGTLWAGRLASGPALSGGRAFPVAFGPHRFAKRLNLLLVYRIERTSIHVLSGLDQITHYLFHHTARLFRIDSVVYREFFKIRRYRLIFRRAPSTFESASCFKAMT